ncbi:hypothetical protein QTQ03_29235 [Micromonospora sp. WMMA1363]|uniref:hypothetical protein n=1 Tax=Micromonospora sp. WMMA1363 TaxID=3053985 RepID=UPI00259D025D|nr:hypothetical protein [Micromonospora sp. WMMA1363]MDM4723468.1 hypothetical protein [Micromonospora sp. WMMA1363]
MKDERHRLTISVPPDVAERLADEKNASAFVTERVRTHIRLEALRRDLAAAGIHVTQRGVAEARARRYVMQAQWPQERYAALEQRVSAAARGEQAEPQAPAA